MQLGDEFLPMGFCPECQKQTLIDIKTMVRKKKNLEVDIAVCPLCDLVLNLDKDFKISWISEREAAELGWIKEEEIPDQSEALIPDLPDPLKGDTSCLSSN